MGRYYTNGQGQVLYVDGPITKTLDLWSHYFLATVDYRYFPKPAAAYYGAGHSKLSSDPQLQFTVS
jgi:hypothetical protein